jgi:hypothetical protein
MKSPEKRMPAGWTFVAGTLFGAVAVLVPLASAGTAHPKPVVPQRGPETVSTAEPVSAPEVAALTAVHAADPVRPAAAAGKRKNPRPTTRHSECELQLD